MPVRIGVAGGIAASSLPEALALAGQDSVAGRVAATLARLAAATWTANRVCRDDAAWLVIRR